MESGWLGVRDIYINSSIVDEGGLVKKKSPIRLRANSFKFKSITLVKDFYAIFGVQLSINNCF